jgi:hypothetical protein
MLKKTFSIWICVANVIQIRSVSDLLVKETGVLEENRRPVAIHW